MKILHTNTHIFRRSLVGLAAALLLAAVNAGLPARAAEPAGRTAEASGAALFGSIDLQRLSTSYKKAADMNTQLKQSADQLQAVFQQQTNFAMLNKVDQTELGVLLQKTAPTSDDTTQINQLEAKSNQAEQQLSTLQNNTAPTADQKAQMQQLLQQQKDGQDALAAMKTDYDTQLQQKEADMSGQVTQEIKAAITTVAKQHGLAVVFDAAVAVYSSNDITDDVLKVLNK